MKKFLKRNTGFLFLFAIACFMLVYSSANAARAKDFQFESELYKGAVYVDNIGISLYENGNFVARRDNVRIDDEKNPDNTWDRRDNDGNNNSDGVLLRNFLNGEYLKLGHKYREELVIKNSGAIPQYCRMIIRKYWVDDNNEQLNLENVDGDKQRDLDPSLIDLELNLEGGWKVDSSWKNKNDNCPETIVLYYPFILEPGHSTPPATKTLTVKGLAAASVYNLPPIPNADGSTTVQTVYDYDGQHFIIEVEANAVQTHNAKSAMTSAWGVSYVNGEQ